MVVRAHDPSAKEVEREGWLCVWGRSELHSEFKACLNYIIKTLSQNKLYYWYPSVLKLHYNLFAIGYTLSSEMIFILTVQK